MVVDLFEIFERLDLLRIANNIVLYRIDENEIHVFLLHQFLYLLIICILFYFFSQDSQFFFEHHFLVDAISVIMQVFYFQMMLFYSNLAEKIQSQKSQILTRELKMLCIQLFRKRGDEKNDTCRFFQYKLLGSTRDIPVIRSADEFQLTGVFQRQGSDCCKLQRMVG